MTDRKPLVILIEDNEEDMFILNRALVEAQFTVLMLHLQNGDQALKFFEETTGDSKEIILLDLNMPKKSGFDVLEHLQKNPLLDTRKIIVFSTSSSKTDMERAKMLGAWDYLVKPDNYEGYVKLAKKLKEYIK